MPLSVRTLLIWLLAIALPVGGAMAAAMRCCAPGHHGAWATAAVEGPAHGHVHVGHGAGDGHLGHDAAASGGHGGGASKTHGVSDEVAASPMATDEVAHGAMESADGNPGSPACGVCAACGTAGAPPTCSLTVAQGPFAEVLGGLVLAPRPDFTTSGPERPPRAVLA